MNFYDRQDRARRQSKLLVLLFVLALLGVILAVSAVTAVALASIQGDTPGLRVPDRHWLAANLTALGWTAVAVTGFILLASLIRSLGLRRGGAALARSLGGMAVDPGTRDPLRRRLYNVVEEMAIASGMPVPDVFVLEQEPGINAFAAGLSPADAAVAVTRGALERLDRNELQGVIGHEFSHIVNGDMRVNLRLLGLLFGILSIGLVGRTVLRGGRHVRVSGRDGRASGAAVAVLALGAALWLIGSVGLFFGRLIQAAVARQREYLADASAVQFTRDPSGLAGALKKIAGYATGTAMVAANADEIGHMLFLPGQRLLAGWLSTHPPIEQRIRALEPQFRPAAAALRGAPIGAATSATAVAALTANPGVPDETGLAAAAALRAALPRELGASARSPSEAPAVLLALLLDPVANVRKRQQRMLQERLGAARCQEILVARARLEGSPPESRLPLAEICLPALRRLPRAELEQFLWLAERLAEADNQQTAFEFALTQLARVFCADLLHAGRPAQKPRDSAAILQASATLLSALAQQGHGEHVAAEQAFRAGMAVLAENHTIAPGLRYAPDSAWSARLRNALDTLDGVEFRTKRRVLSAAIATVEANGLIEAAEKELLRAIAASLHVPLPPAHA